MNDNERTPEELELTKKLNEFFRASARAGTRLVVHTDGYFDVRVFCGGSLPITAYSCALQPGHKGKCFSSNKQVNFKPEVGTARAEEQAALRKVLLLSIEKEPFEKACFVAGGEDSGFGTSIEYAECVKNLKWWDPIGEPRCAVIYEVRIIGAFAWYMDCVKLFGPISR